MGGSDVIQIPSGICGLCGTEATLKCANCKQTFYCKRECQKEDWTRGHKKDCKPIKIIEDKVKGRCLVATRQINKGEVIFKDDPIVVGPKQIVEPLCLSCYKKVNAKNRCGKCNWPVCGPACEDSSEHKAECVIGQLMGSPIEITDFNEPNHFYEVVTPLRCMTLKKSNPKKYEQLLELESHYNERKSTDIYKENQKRVVNMLRNYFMLLDMPNEEIDCTEITIHKITGILDVNSVDIKFPDRNVVGIYPTYSLIEHSCLPNIRCVFNKNKQMTVKAVANIEDGEHLSTCYTEMLWGTIARREHLKLSKYFMCTCKRCTDPTELGLNFSSLRCQECPLGSLNSAAPLDEMASWVCNSCNTAVNVDEIKQITLDLGEQVERTLKKPTIESLENFVNKLTSTLVSENHFHLFPVRNTLLQLYSSEENASEKTLSKKEKICKNFIQICTTLDPGMSQLYPYLSTALYEYHLIIINRATGVAQAGGKPDIKQFDVARKLLKQCIESVKDEPDDYPEGQLRKVASENLMELEAWIASS